MSNGTLDFKPVRCLVEVIQRIVSVCNDEYKPHSDKWSDAWVFYDSEKKEKILEAVKYFFGNPSMDTSEFYEFWAMVFGFEERDYSKLEEKQQLKYELILAVIRGFNI
jgi:hypothetical protein